MSRDSRLGWRGRRDWWGISVQPTYNKKSSKPFLLRSWSNFFLPYSTKVFFVVPFWQLKKSTIPQILAEISTPIRMTTKTHPFFEDLQALPSNLKSFYDKVLATEGDIFEEWYAKWAHYEKFLLETLYDVVKLDDYTVMSITIEVISEVAAMP